MKIDHLTVNFNNTPVVHTNRYLGMYLGEQLKFDDHIREKNSKGKHTDWSNLQAKQYPAKAITDNNL